MSIWGILQESPTGRRSECKPRTHYITQIHGSGGGCLCLPWCRCTLIKVDQVVMDQQVISVISYQMYFVLLVFAAGMHCFVLIPASVVSNLLSRSFKREQWRHQSIKAGKYLKILSHHRHTLLSFYVCTACPLKRQHPVTLSFLPSISKGFKGNSFVLFQVSDSVFWRGVRNVRTHAISLGKIGSKSHEF